MTDPSPARPAAEPEEDTRSAAESDTDALGDRDRSMLDFERTTWRHPGAKEQAIRDAFGVSAARYYQHLGTLIDTRAALAYDPLLVGRLRRRRDERLAARAARTFSRPQ